MVTMFKAKSIDFYLMNWKSSIITIKMEEITMKTCILLLKMDVTTIV